MGSRQGRTQRLTAIESGILKSNSQKHHTLNHEHQLRYWQYDRGTVKIITTKVVVIEGSSTASDVVNGGVGAKASRSNEITISEIRQQIVTSLKPAHQKTRLGK